MGFVRHILFPSLRLIVWSVIAVSLAYLAFVGGTGAGSAQSASPAEPGAVFSDPVVTVETGTVANTVTIDATVVSDPPSDVRSTREGTVGAFAVADGARVGAGAAILEVRQEVAADPVQVTDANGNVTVSQPAPRVRRSIITTPIAGTVTLKVLLNQPVAIGDVVASVSPGSFSVSGPVSAEQQYRLIGAPSEASVEVTGGPAPFTCTGLSTSTTAAPAADPATGDTSGASVQVRCAIPAGTVVFAGLTGTMTVTSGEAADVLVVPVTAVQGLYATGNVWVVPPDGGEAVSTPVGLGLTDGELVQVTSGLAEGDTILEFIPVGDVSRPDPALGM